MMREHKVLAATVQIECLTEELHRHRRALDVPAWPSTPQRRLPTLLARLARLPQREVPRRVLLVFININPRTVLDALEVLARQLAILREARDAEVPAPIISLVRYIPRRKLLN